VKLARIYFDIMDTKPNRFLSRLLLWLDVKSFLSTDTYYRKNI